jgi:hypothetical protein
MYKSDITKPFQFSIYFVCFLNFNENCLSSVDYKKDAAADYSYR